MNNVGIADSIYQVILDEITTVVDVEDQKEITTYVVNDLIHRYDIGNNVSDGCHTFGKYYDKHIIHLFIALCKSIIKRNDLEMEKLQFYKDKAKEGSNCKGDIIKKLEGLPSPKDIKIEIIKSKKHFDCSEYEGWFIVQLKTTQGQISYHLPNEYWDECYFIKTVDKANEWDGHTSDDVLKRLLLI